MECLIIPGIIAGVIGILFAIGQWLEHRKRYYDTDNLGIVFWTCIGFLVLALVACPLGRQVFSRPEALTAQSYYENVITPNIVEEYDTYVVVGDAVTGIWQAGDYNVAKYNSYLKTTSYWDAVPIIGSVVYPVPDKLKFVIVK